MPKRKSALCLEHYDCIGFDLDHTLCRYNIGPMIRYSCYCISDDDADYFGRSTF